jgi:hypothetical protein
MFPWDHLVNSHKRSLWSDMPTIHHIYTHTWERKRGRLGCAADKYNGLFTRNTATPYFHVCILSNCCLRGKWNLVLTMLKLLIWTHFQLLACHCNSTSDDYLGYYLSCSVWRFEHNHLQDKHEPVYFPGYWLMGLWERMQKINIPNKSFVSQIHSHRDSADKGWLVKYWLDCWDISPSQRPPLYSSKSSPHPLLQIGQGTPLGTAKISANTPLVFC